MSRKERKKADSEARTASAAVFFNENKSIAGFGNPLRAVFTSIRELVENALDAAEKRNITPNIELVLRRISMAEVSRLMDIKASKLKDKRLDFLELSCKDNGVGVERNLIPQLFGTVLSGTKYGAQQTRGRFGLGSKMVLLYSMSTLDLPIQITTRPINSKNTYLVKLFINLEKNEPILVEDKVLSEGDADFFEDYGTEVKVSFTGSWSQAKNYVLEYFRQISIITPYADFSVSLPGVQKDTLDHLQFKKVVKDLPNPPQVISVHPWGTDITTFRKEVSLAHPKDNTKQFLIRNFMGIDEAAAVAFLEEVGIVGSKKPADLTDKEIRRVVHDGFARALQESKEVKRKRDRIFKFDDPKGDALSPLGAERLRKGIEKELEPVFVEAIIREPKAYEGHPFIIEIAIGYGGGVTTASASKAVSVVDNRVIYRYANRIPLIFGAGSDVISHVVNQIKWNEYGLTRQTDPLAIAVSLVSTKIPFPETSKEYIDRVPEIEEEIYLGILQLGRKLKSFLNRARRKKREHQRQSRFEKYAPQTVRNIIQILKNAEIWNKYTGLQENRVIAALASGAPRIARSPYPRYKPIFSEPIWGLPEYEEKLQATGIVTVESFLKETNSSLAKNLQIPVESVDRIKRRTLYEGSLSNHIPEISPEFLVFPEIEKRFHTPQSQLGFSKLTRAFSRRWIRNVWDYLVTPNELLMLIQGYNVKLLEQMKLNLLFEIASALQKTNELSFKERPAKVSSKLQLKHMIPSFQEVLKHPAIAKRQISNWVEFLSEFSHPSSPIDFTTFADLQAQSFKRFLAKKVKKKPELAKVKIETQHEWLDGFIRNAFKRRKLTKISDLISCDDSVIANINELLRVLTAEFVEMLRTKRFLLSKYVSGNKNKQLVRALNTIGISTISDLANTSVIAMVKAKKSKNLLDILLKRSKEDLSQHLFESNIISPLNLLKVVSKELETHLYDQNIDDMNALLRTPLEKFPKDSRDRITTIKLQTGTSLSVLSKSDIEILSKLQISCLEEIVFNGEFYLNQPKVLAKSKKSLTNVLNVLLYPITIFSKELVNAHYSLIDVGINSVGKFLVWPNDELANITKLSEEWLQLLKEGFQLDFAKQNYKTLTPIVKVSALLTKAENELLKLAKLKYLEEIISYSWNASTPKIASTTFYHACREILLSEISILKKICDKKEQSTASKVIKYLQNSNILTLHELLTLSKEATLNKLSTKHAKATVLEFYEKFIENPEFEITRENKTLQAIKFQQILAKFSLPPANLRIFTNVQLENLSKAGIITIHQVFSLDLSQLSEILRLSEKAVKTIFAKCRLISKGTPLTIFKGAGKIQSVFSFEFEGALHFAEKELASIIQTGYDTVEILYYRSNSRTFAVPGLSWNLIAQMKSFLRSPAVLISWREKIKQPVAINNSERKLEKGTDLKLDPKTAIKSEHTTVTTVSQPTLESVLESTTTEKPSTEVENTGEEKEIYKYKSLSTKELKLLSDAKQTSVLDFLTISSNELSQLLGWTKEETAKRQTSIFLQEVGVNLSELGIFRDSTIEALADINLTSIEDLFFSTFEDNWDNQVLPWESIRIIKGILLLPIESVEELGGEIITLLSENKILTILDFLLTGNSILEQKTGFPAERFENLKHSIDFPILIDAFDKPACFVPGLSYNDVQTLLKNGIFKVVDIIHTPVEKLAKLLKTRKSSIQKTKNRISRKSVSKKESLDGVPLKDITVFTRSEITQIQKSGIFECRDLKTIQEVHYLELETGAYMDNFLLRKLKVVKKILQMGLDKLDITKSDCLILEKMNIYTVADLLFISIDEKVGQNLTTLISRISREYMDFRPLVVLGLLPVSTGYKQHKAVLEIFNQFDGSDTSLDDFMKNETSSLFDEWVKADSKIEPLIKSEIYYYLLLPSSLLRILNEYGDLPFETTQKTIADIYLSPELDLETSNLPIARQLFAPGFFLNEIRRFRTPVSFLELNSKSLRGLYHNELFTIERLMTKDVKFLSQITDQTQKYFSTIIKNYSNVNYEQILKEQAIPLSLLRLTDSLVQKLHEVGIEYFEQIPIAKELNEPEIRKLVEFFFGSNIFLSSYQAEVELALKEEAFTVAESIVIFRKGLTTIDIETILDILLTGIQVRKQVAFQLPKITEWYKNNFVLSVQDLISHYQANPTHPFSKQDLDLIHWYSMSTLFLPLSKDKLFQLVNQLKCSRIIDALTHPLAQEDVATVKHDSTGKPVLHTEVELPLSILKKLSVSMYNRFPKDVKINLQEIVSSPRLTDNYKGVKQVVMKAARDLLDIPLSRILIDGAHLSTLYTFPRFSTLLYGLTELSINSNEILQNILNSFSGKITILPELALPINTRDIVSTAFGQEVTGFHELWAVSFEKYKILNLSKLSITQQAKSIILRCFLPLTAVSFLSQQENWLLWKAEVFTITEFILKPSHIVNLGIFSKKRYLELREEAVLFLAEKKKLYRIPIYHLTSTLKIQLSDLEPFDLPLLFSQLEHPLFDAIHKNANTTLVISQPLLTFNFVENLTFSDLKTILSLQIHSLADFLLYPEDKTKLPEKLVTYISRISLLRPKFTSGRIDKNISTLNLPESLFDEFNQRKIQRISELINFCLNEEINFDIGLLTVSLRFTSLSKKIREKLQTEGITTILDLIIAPPKNLNMILKIKKKDWQYTTLQTFDYTKIRETQKAAFLPVDKIVELSDKGKAVLKSKHYFSFLDLPETHEIVPKNDLQVLKRLEQIVASPSKILYYSEKFPDKLNTSFPINSEKTLKSILTSDVKNKEFFDYCKSFSSTDLFALVESTKKLNVFNSINANEARVLTKAGNFTFQQIANCNTEQLVKLGIQESTSKKILDDLNLSSTVIKSAKEHVLAIIQQSKITKVWQVLDHLDITEQDIQQLIIEKPTYLSEIFSGKLLEFLTTLRLTTFPQFLKSKRFQQQFAKNNEDAIAVFSILHYPLQLVSIDTKIYRSLNQLKVDNIWQLFERDSFELATRIGITYQKMAIYKQQVSKALQNAVPADFYISEVEKVKHLPKYGIFRLQDLGDEGYLLPMYKVNEVFAEEIQSLNSIINHGIWELDEYWKLPPTMKTRIATSQTGMLKDLVETQDKDVNKNLLRVFEISFKQKWRNQTKLSKIEGLKVSSKLGKFKTFENWYYLYLQSNVEAFNEQVVEYFRRPISDIANLTVKTLLRAYDNGIHTVTDIYLLGSDKVSTLLKVRSKTKFKALEFIEKENSLYKIAIISTKIYENIDKSATSTARDANEYYRFRSWHQLLGRPVLSDFRDRKGVSLKSFSPLLQVGSLELWKIPPFRDLGIEKVQKLLEAGCTKLLDLLLMPVSLLAKILKLEHQEIHDTFVKVSKSVINRSLSKPSTPLTVVPAVKSSHIALLKNLGVYSIYQIILEPKFKIKDVKLAKGIETLMKFLARPVDRLDLIAKIEKELKQGGILKISEFVFYSDTYITSISSISPQKLSQLRKTLKQKTSVQKTLKQKRPKQKQVKRKK